MYIDFKELPASQVYFTMTQTLIPRPIAWVLSENGDGGLNLAPFSYFTAVCSSPPLVMISVGKQPGGGDKDTRVNIEARREFVIHIAPSDMLAPLNGSAATLPRGVSEVERLGLETVPFEGSRLPRVVGCRIAYACGLHEIREIGDAPQALVFGRVKGVWLADEAVERTAAGRLKVHAERVDPLARLGASEYMRMGEVIGLKRPK